MRCNHTRRCVRQIVLAAWTLCLIPHLSGWQPVAAAGYFNAIVLQQDEDPRSAAAAFAPSTGEEIRTQLLTWLAQAKVDEATARSIAERWADPAVVDNGSADELLSHLIHTLALADSGLKQMVDDAARGVIPDTLVYDGLRNEPFFRNNVQLWHARWLTQHRLYDEAIAILDNLNPEMVADPATCFFCRAACQQQLLRAAEARDSLALLLNNTLDVPARYRAVGEMMQQQLQDYSDKGMPQVARVMNDVHRRLDLGRSGESTQEQETRVVSLLDDLLEEMEKQQQQQQGGQGSSQSQQNRPGEQGASQSQVKGSAADGVADRKELTETGGWGMLDQKSEAKARELIRQQFPANFMDAISKYTQKIAEGSQ